MCNAFLLAEPLRRSELKKQIREENKIITNLEKEYEATICLEGSLKRSVETLDRIASKVDAFSGIWHIVGRILPSFGF